MIRPVAVDRHRGRLLSDDHGGTLGHSDVADQPTRLTVVGELARLQCTLLGRLGASERAGLLRLPPRAAGDCVRAIARGWAALPASHPLHIESDAVERAEHAAEGLDRCTARVADTVPLDLEINDVYAANICADRSTGSLRPKFFDFGNAIWGHPFVTVHGFLDSIEEWNEAPLPAADRDALYDRYLSVWCDRLGADPRTLRRDLLATRVLVHVHRLAAWLRLVPYADSIEIRSRAEIPLKWMNAIAADITGR
ncbi:MAG TPA: hypothetical protein VHC49_09095 [Mycobacteriales bacterium]|nr:hypothetical protein [Mycobacteriales bacterium]